MVGNNKISIIEKGLVGYVTTWEKMRGYSRNRTEDSKDYIWLVQHPPVFTQGQAGKKEHILQPGDIPVVQTDRGGQVTYHGPGQLVMYPLIDLRRYAIGIRALVTLLEETAIEFLASHNVTAVARKDAPGVYIDNAKIAAIGLRISKGCSYHGISFNVDMNLEPFKRINPCGMQGLEVTQLKDQGINVSIEELGLQLASNFIQALNVD